MTAYIWDLDGTLLDSYGVIAESARRTAADAGADDPEEYGLKVWLCHEHHTGVNGVHSSKGSQLMQELKELGQVVFTEKYGDELFFQRFGKNYLKGDTDEDE